MKQSSIEWLAIQIMDNWNDITVGARDIAEFIDKAKAMHKEEIENAVKQGWDYNEEGLVKWMGEKYYNETFNTEECYHKGKYTYNKETFECHKCGLIVPNEYRFNSKEK